MRRTAHGSAGSVWFLAALVGCVHGTLEPAFSAQRGALRAVGVGGRADPTEHGARVIPEAAGEDRAYGVEPSGGIRAIASGVRIINLPNGAALAAQDRLPQAPGATAKIPDRLGGGFLFVIGNVVWRASSWLAPARPIFSSPASISRVIVGLDRVYLRGPNGSHQAIDPRDGTALDLGPWPGSSFVGAYAALDGWRAVAVNDLRGVVATVDAGATWKPLGLPIDPQTVTVLDDAIAVGGTDALRQTQWFEVRDGAVSHLPAPPAVAVATGPDHAASMSSLAPAARPFGARPLLAAIEDGWPLTDGTAVVARDGTLARIRLEDGALVELAPDAFPMKTSRCHPFALAEASGIGEARGREVVAGRPPKTGSFAFVCGEPRGRTILYSYDAANARLEELRRFSAPRVVLASGNGALAVRGGCAEDGPAQEESRTEQSYCLLPRGGPWREIRVRNVAPAAPPGGPTAPRPTADAGTSEEAAEIGDERVIVLDDGRVAIVSPPRGDLTTARLTVLDHDRSTTVPISFAGAPSDVSHILRLGIWLDGMEERRPGVIGGWVEAAGAMLGVEIQLDGHAKTGMFVRDAGAPMVSGRYGLGWSASRRGYETTDGGMTWTSLDLPEPLALDQTVRVRACGPLGCTAKGWLRVGWGALANPTPTPPPVAFRPGWRPAPPLSLDCEPAAPPPHTAEDAPEVPVIDFDPFTGGRRLALPTGDTRPFYSVAPPAHHADETLITAEANEPVERQVRATLLARIYAWGPKSEDWPHAGHWQARWLWPFGGWQDLRSTQPGPAPFANADAAARGLVTQPAANTALGWTFASGDDGGHALLFGRHGAETTVLELDGDRPLAQLYRVDGEPFGEIDSAVRASGRWYMATAQGAGELPAEVLWQVDGTGARELARIGRAGLDGHASPVRMARRSDGRFVGLVVDGQPPAERGIPLRWVMPVDVESGALGEPELLGLADMSDRAEVPPCVGDAVGWILDTPMAGAARLRFDEREASLGNLYGRLRWTRAHVCMNRLSGTLDSSPSTTVDVSKAVRRRIEEPTISVSGLATGRGRYPFRCKR